MALRVTTAPASEPVTLVEAKAHLRVTDPEDDTYITALIVAARDAAEHKTQRSLITQTLTLTLDRFPESEGKILLRRPPVTAVTFVKYLDTANVLTTLDAAEYVTDFETEPGRIVPAYGYLWPQTYDAINAVTVEYVAGYANAAAVPQQIKNWMLMRLSAMYENREEVTTDGRAAIMMPFVDGLLDRYCVQVY